LKPAVLSFFLKKSGKNPCRFLLDNRKKKQKVR
jgi:hypothetical protein